MEYDAGIGLDLYPSSIELLPIPTPDEVPRPWPTAVAMPGGGRPGKDSEPRRPLPMLRKSGTKSAKSWQINFRRERHEKAASIGSSVGEFTFQLAEETARETVESSLRARQDIILDTTNTYMGAWIFTICITHQILNESRKKQKSEKDAIFVICLSFRTFTGTCCDSCCASPRITARALNISSMSEHSLAPFSISATATAALGKAFASRALPSLAGRRCGERPLTLLWFDAAAAASAGEGGAAGEVAGEELSEGSTVERF